ncbi:uncharacterized protein LOC124257985 [Haliotis rubra]|uniref:uncharacterized protein LOC124257985 n=1 Tax=Haliotis rubra TaxID=36100 RepID=UPI001EE5B044|nr:uncharacterized protein LOC124257985 [Haliotis rubra]
MPNKEDMFVLDTDASDVAIGAELLQIQKGRERVISYGSFALTPEQRRYCTTHKELLAVVRFTRQYRHYLLGRHFRVRTDHNSLRWLMNFRAPEGQLARWLEELSQYDLRVEHRPGAKHQNADGLSRLADEVECDNYRRFVELQELPCGGCRYCQKAHQQTVRALTVVEESNHLTEVPTGEDAGGEGGSRTENQAHTLEVSRSETTFSVRTLTVPECPQKGDKDSWDGSLTALKIAQEEDRDLRHLRRWVDGGEVPSDSELYLSSLAAKSYWVDRELFERNEEGVLVRKGIPAVNDTEKLLIPRTLQRMVLYQMHDIPSSGHLGVTKTKERIKERYHWYRCGQDTRDYVSECSACNRNKKPSRKARSRMTPFHAGAPMERVHLDCIGPLPSSRAGNQHILMMVDQFTKWVECVPLPSQKAEVTARAAVNEFIARFGFPLQIHADQGRNFESRLFHEICQLLQITKTRTTPYRPSSNGQLAGAMRSAVNRHTGYTANRLMLGREVNVPADLMFGGSETSRQEGDTSEYVAGLRAAMESAHAAALNNLQTSVERMKRDYDLRARSQSLDQGQPVYVLDLGATPGRCKKLCPVWKGPYLIEKRLSSTLFLVAGQRRKFTAHHDQMKLCRDRVVPR